jgi:hypothetical protein
MVPTNPRGRAKCRIGTFFGRCLFPQHREEIVSIILDLTVPQSRGESGVAGQKCWAYRAGRLVNPFASSQ